MCVCVCVGLKGRQRVLTGLEEGPAADEKSGARGVWAGGAAAMWVLM